MRWTKLEFEEFIRLVPSMCMSRNPEIKLGPRNGIWIMQPERYQPYSIALPGSVLIEKAFAMEFMIRHIRSAAGVSGFYISVGGFLLNVKVPFLIDSQGERVMVLPEDLHMLAAVRASLKRGHQNILQRVRAEIINTRRSGRAEVQPSIRAVFSRGPRAVYMEMDGVPIGIDPGEAPAEPVTRDITAAPIRQLPEF